ncbi:MAG: type II secretion system F family protein [Bacilli bacterium]
MPENYNMSLFIIQIFIILLLLGITVWLLLLTKAIKYEKRISKYAIDSIKDTEESFFDKVFRLYHYIRSLLSKFLHKIHIFDTYSLKYSKYIDGSKKLREEPMDYISLKILSSFLVLAVVILSDVMQYQPISFIQVVYSLLIGFFVPDIFLISKNKLKKRQIENDLLKAIIIMNNAFKSGRSTMQAIDIVAHEVDGPIKDEFQKMYIDLTYGLSLETVFRRFSSRVDVMEVKYITTSLIILNRTGGNIVKVFSSIERSFFSRKKLQEELKSLTASARVIFNVLIFMPIILFFLIYILNPKYFLPLVTTSIGLIIIVIILVLYISYILIVRKIMQVE